MDAVELQHQKLVRLYDYTKFHIALYTTLTAALLAVMSIGEDAVPAVYRLPAIVMTFFFILAGGCGGIVAVNTLRHTSYDELMDSKPPILGRPRRWTIENIANWEHNFFWLGILVGFGSVVGITLCTWLRTGA